MFNLLIVPACCQSITTTKSDFFFGEGPPGANSAYLVRGARFFFCEGPPGANSAHLVRGRAAAAAAAAAAAERTNERTNERTDKRMIERTNFVVELRPY